MNKFELYRQIRGELTTHYDKEQRLVSTLLDEGVEAVVSTSARIACAESDTLVANGEASKVFRQEINEAIRIILERYQRALRKEVEALGLSNESSRWQEAAADHSTSIVASGELGNGVEKH